MMPCTLISKFEDDFPSQARSGADQCSRFSAILRCGFDGRCLGHLPLSYGLNVSCNRVRHCRWIGRSRSGYGLGESDCRPGGTSVISSLSVASKRRGRNRPCHISESAGTCDIGLRRHAERYGHGPLGCLSAGSSHHSGFGLGYKEDVEPSVVQRTSRRRRSVWSDGGSSANSSSAPSFGVGSTFLPPCLLWLLGLCLGVGAAY